MDSKTNGLALGAVLLLASLSTRAQQYTVTDLGTLGGTNSGRPESSAGTGINASGQVTGYSVSKEVATQVHAFITNATTNVMTDLGALGWEGNISEGYAINASGQVTGYSVSDDFNNPIHAFVTDAATNAMTDLGTLACGTSNYCNGSSYGTAINDSGQVTGYSSTATNSSHAFITSATTNVMTDLNGSCSYSCASGGYGINASGQVTGWVSVNGAYSHAFVTDAATNSMTDLGTLGGASSIGYGINASGQVTGGALTESAELHAFLYSNGSMQDLGTLGGATSQGNGIDASGQVVGQALTSSGASHAFLYSQGSMRDLNLEIGSAAAAYTLTAGQGINSSGQIVVNGVVNATGLDVALLLTPVPISTTTTLTSSARSSTYGSPLMLTALVTPISGPTPTGFVIFQSGNISYGTVAVNGTGQAVLTTHDVQIGTHFLTATYSGSTPDLGSSSAAVGVKVSPAETVTSLTALPSSGVIGTAIRLEAVVTPRTGILVPTGTVRFDDDNTMLANVALNGSGIATYVTTALATGEHRIKAHYIGTVDDLKSHSVAVRVTITTPLRSAATQR